MRVRAESETSEKWSEKGSMLKVLWSQQFKRECEFFIKTL